MPSIESAEERRENDPLNHISVVVVVGLLKENQVPRATMLCRVTIVLQKVSCFSEWPQTHTHN